MGIILVKQMNLFVTAISFAIICLLLEGHELSSHLSKAIQRETVAFFFSELDDHTLCLQVNHLSEHFLVFLDFSPHRHTWM